MEGSTVHGWDSPTDSDEEVTGPRERGGERGKERGIGGERERGSGSFSPFQGDNSHTLGGDSASTPLDQEEMSRFDESGPLNSRSEGESSGDGDGSGSHSREDTEGTEDRIQRFLQDKVGDFHLLFLFFTNFLLIEFILSFLCWESF